MLSRNAIALTTALALMGGIKNTGVGPALAAHAKPPTPACKTIAAVKALLTNGAHVRQSHQANSISCRASMSPYRIRLRDCRQAMARCSFSAMESLPRSCSGRAETWRAPRLGCRPQLSRCSATSSRARSTKTATNSETRRVPAIARSDMHRTAWR